MYKFATFCESSVEFDLCNNVDTLIQYLKNDAKQKNIPEQTYYSSIENQIN